MKIAYIVLCHKDPQLLSRLIDRLTKDEDNYIFIHVDRKTNKNDFEIIKESEQVQFIKNNIDITWAGFNSIKATINSFKQAMEYKSFDRFVILQGLDYPIKSNSEIKEFFIENKNIEFISGRKETGLKSAQNKYCLHWNLDKHDLFHRILTDFCKLLKVLKINFKIRKDYIYVENKKYDIYRGWAHIALTYSAVKYIIKFYDNNPKFNKYFSNVFSSDESYFHTIIYNSNKFQMFNRFDSNEQSMLNLTYFEYPYYVRIFKTKQEFLKLKLDDYLYIRKVTSEESKDLLDYLDENI